MLHIDVTRKLVGLWKHGVGLPSEGPFPPGTSLETVNGAFHGPDQLDNWFILSVPMPPRSVLEFGGLATHCEVWLDGVRVARSDTMFRPLLVTVPEGGASRLEVVARALNPAATRPRPRWRNRLVPSESLRTVRTTPIGRIAPGENPIVGPFYPVLLHPPGGPRRVRLSVRLEDGDGVVEVGWSGPGIGGEPVTIRCGRTTATLRPDGVGVAGTVRLIRPERWWPHTHGIPVLHEIYAGLGGEPVHLGDAGFRTVERLEGEGFGLRINGVPVFCRGAIWSGAAPVLDRMAPAGLNMLRVAGGTLYAPAEVFAITDRAGIMVWQDFMFTRFDYPADPAFLEEARREASAAFDRIGASPSLAVLCGGDEVAQAAAMAGRPETDWRHPLFDEVLPSEAARRRPDVPYIPNAPFGGTPPFAKSAPVTHYFGIGAYQRPLHDAGGVRFAAACLAFSNPAAPETCRALAAVPGSAAWAAQVPRDPGAPWTFEDVRDHYAATLLNADMPALRRTDPERWLATGRAGVALAMQSALSTWRCDPACNGALVLGWDDIDLGPGLGLIDADGRAKSALHAVSGVCQPVQVLVRDEGMDGIVVHAINETPALLTATLRLRGLTLAGDAEALGEIAVELPPRSVLRLTATGIMGRFVDLAGAWRFGPAPYRALGAMLLTDRVLSTATLFLDAALPRERLGLSVVSGPDGLGISTTRFAQFVAIDAGAHEPEEDHFHLWPGETRHVRLRGAGRAAGSVSALNGLDPSHFSARS